MAVSSLLLLLAAITMFFSNDTVLATVASRHGVAVNENGGTYRNGATYGLEKKVAIAAEYLRASDAANGARPVISSVAKDCGVFHNTVLKIEKELQTHGRVLDPSEIIPNRRHGLGAYTLEDRDIFVLIQLQARDPTRSNSSYKTWLKFYMGTDVSESTISRFFLEGFMFKGSFCKPNLVPYDKFKPENIEKAMEFAYIAKLMDPRKIKFGDEKHLKGAEIYCRQSRRNVITGEVASIKTPSDFRNTYTITGFCGIDSRVTPVCHAISKYTNNAESFGLVIMHALAYGLFRGNFQTSTSTRTVKWEA